MSCHHHFDRLVDVEIRPIYNEPHPVPNNSFMDGDEIPVRAASYSLVKSYLRQRIENLRGDETPRWDVRRRCSIANSRETFFSFSLFSLFPHEPPLRRYSTGQWVLIDRSLGGPFERRHNAKWREIGGWLVEGGVEEIKEVEKKGRDWETTVLLSGNDPFKLDEKF